MVGLKVDDVIIKINNEESSSFNLAEATSEIGKGTEKLELTIERYRVYFKYCKLIDCGHLCTVTGLDGEPMIKFMLSSSRACGARKISTEKAAGTFSLFLGAGGTEVIQESEAFFSNREELERY